MSGKTVHVVHIVESEKGWGRKCSEEKEFGAESTAKDFVSKFNDDHNLKHRHAPDWYMKAQYMGEFDPITCEKVK